MLTVLILALALGGGLALLGYLVTRRAGVALGAGLAGLVLGVVVADYLWLPMARASLPEGEVVARVTRESSTLKPWTLVRPASVRLVAVAADRAEPHGMVQGQRIVPLHFVGRSEPELTVQVLFDCRALRQMPITDETARDAAGVVVDPDWQQLDEQDTVLRAACAPATQPD